MFGSDAPAAGPLGSGQQVIAQPDAKIVAVCELGKISTLAAATLRDLGFRGATALDGGMKAWREAGHPLEVESPAAS